MKFPVTSSPNPKPISCNSSGRNAGFHSHNHSNSNSNSNTNIASNFCYEPTSVLDLRRSPSPVAAHEKPVSAGNEISAISDAAVVVQSDNNDPSVQWDEHLLHNLDDWDSIMRDLGLHDDSVSIVRASPGTINFSDFAPSSQQQQQQQQQHAQFVLSDINFSDMSLNHHHHHQTVNHHQNSNPFDLSNWNVGFDFVEELIRAAGCFDSNELQLAQVILSRLNQRLGSPIGKPLQRAAFYFKEALNSLLTGSNNRSVRTLSSEIVSTIKAYKAFSAISPVPMFSNFTANQALLEAVEGSMFVHIVDFDIGFGGQYASFMKEIADRAEACKVTSSVVRVTAVVPEEYAVETRLIRDNLCQFAQDLRINFHIEFVSIRTFEMLSFKAIKFIDGEKIAVLLSPTIFRRIGPGFVNDLRRISPSVVVFVDGEGCMDSVATPSSSFRRSFVEGLEFYSVVLESLDAAASGGGSDWVRKIETSLLRPKILAAVEASSVRQTASGREIFVGAGMRPVALSQFADIQAECLLRKAQVRGFHVAKRQGELVLCWNGRALVATSAWRC